MFPFDLTATNILLIVAVVALFVLFVTVLMKLNPSTEKEENFEPEMKVESPKPPQTAPAIPRSLQPPPARTEIPRIIQKTPPIVNTNSDPSIKVQMKQTLRTPNRSESKEQPRPEKLVAPPPVRMETSTSKKDCFHQFGYLRTLPKNAPIPDECFGCPKIVECLVNTKK